jgi:histone H3/H4
MSTRRAAPRVVKTARKPAEKNTNKNVPEVTETAAVQTVVEVVQSQANNVQPVAEPTTVTTTTDTAAKPSKPTFSHISAARVRQYLDKGSMNKVINDSYKVMKAELSALKTATEALKTGTVKSTVKATVDGKEVVQEVVVPTTPQQVAEFEATVARVTPFVSEYELKMDALSRERERFSSEAPVVLSIVCDELVRQLVTHTIDHALSKGKKIIQVCHMHSEGVDKLPLYRLVASLPSFQRNAELFSKKQSNEDMAKLRKKIKNEAWSEYRKLYNSSLVREQKNKKQKQAAAGALKAPPMVLPIKAPEDVLAPEHEEAGEVDEEVDESDNKSSFLHYVSSECKDIALTYLAQHGKLRVSAAIKVYLSDLLIEFIERMSTLISLTTSTMTRKTVNGNAILRTIEKLLVDGHRPVETLEFRPTEVPDPKLKSEELKKKAEAEAKGEKYKVDFNSLPKVQGYTAVHTVKYPSSGFDELQKFVDERLKLYRESSSEKTSE